MWTREELKTRGKAAFLRNYWICVVAALILTLLVGSGTSNSGNSNNDSHQTNSVGISGFTISSDNFNVESFAERFTPLGPVKFVFTVFSGIVLLVIGLAFILIRIFVLAPFEVGGSRFFIENSMEKAGLGNILFGFQNGYYGKTVWTLFLKNLYIFLWSLLLLIPGIVKAYEYRMVPYLLADYPELSTEEAFRISREMMNGEKMNTFILDLLYRMVYSFRNHLQSCRYFLSVSVQICNRCRTVPGSETELLLQPELWQYVSGLLNRTKNQVLLFFGKHLIFYVFLFKYLLDIIFHFKIPHQNIGTVLDAKIRGIQDHMVVIDIAPCLSGIFVIILGTLLVCLFQHHLSRLSCQGKQLHDTFDPILFVRADINIDDVAFIFQKLRSTPSNDNTRLFRQLADRIRLRFKGIFTHAVLYIVLIIYRDMQSLGKFFRNNTRPSTKPAAHRNN